MPWGTLDLTCAFDNVSHPSSGHPEMEPVPDVLGGRGPEAMEQPDQTFELVRGTDTGASENVFKHATR